MQRVEGAALKVQGVRGAQLPKVQVVWGPQPLRMQGGSANFSDIYRASVFLDPKSVFLDPIKPKVFF